MKRRNNRKTYLHEKGSSRIRFSHAAEAGIIIAMFLTSIFIFIAIYNHILQPLYLIDDSQPVFQGFNGYGFVENYHPETNAVQVLTEKEKQLKKEGKDTEELNRLISSISCSFTYEDNLTNGKTITYGCSYDQAAAIKAGYSLHHLHRTFTVTDLKQIQTIDPFDEIKVSIDKAHHPLISISDKLAPIHLAYQYSFPDASHITIRLQYSKDDAARNGYHFSVSEKTISIDTNYLNLDMNTLSHLSKEDIEKVNEAAWRLHFSSMMNNININDYLPADAVPISRLTLERWYLADDGRLTVIYIIDTDGPDGRHTWEIPVRYDISVRITAASGWSVYLNDADNYTVDHIQEGEYNPEKAFNK